MLRLNFISFLMSVGFPHHIDLIAGDSFLLFFFKFICAKTPKQLRYKNETKTNKTNKKKTGREYQMKKLVTWSTVSGFFCAKRERQQKETKSLQVFQNSFFCFVVVFFKEFLLFFFFKFISFLMSICFVVVVCFTNFAH